MASFFSHRTPPSSPKNYEKKKKAGQKNLVKTQRNNVHKQQLSKMMRAWNKLMHQAGGRGDEMDPSMWGMDMDLDPEEAMAVMESMQGNNHFK